MEENNDEQDVQVDELKKELNSAKKDKKLLRKKVDGLEAENKKLKETRLPMSRMWRSWIRRTLFLLCFDSRQVLFNRLQHFSNCRYYLGQGILLPFSVVFSFDKKFANTDDIQPPNMHLINFIGLTPPPTDKFTAPS